MDRGHLPRWRRGKQGFWHVVLGGSVRTLCGRPAPEPSEEMPVDGQPGWGACRLCVQSARKRDLVPPGWTPGKWDAGVTA